MKIITLDFETYFDDEYSLNKMTTEAYVRDPRFETLLVAVRDNNGTHSWYSGNDRRVFLDSIDWSTTYLLCHHAHFDGLILSHHYGVKPRAWLDTLSMARLILGNYVSVSLASLAAHFNLAAKSVPYSLFKGRHWHQLAADTQQLVAAGACHDVELTWQLFNLLRSGFPREEYKIIDMTVRMFTEPKLEADIDLLGKVWQDEFKRKDDALRSLGVSAAELQSPERFAELLRAQGVEPATKQGKHGPIYAFAKTDEFMKELQDDDNPIVRDLCSARLGVRSTIDQTRAERLGFMASRGPMCVYLSYCGAHTTRWSGGDKVNWQNFRRGGDLRRAIRAPQGSKLAVVDLSQIECRILNYLAGQHDVIDNFRAGKDPYIGIASQFYGRAITKNDPSERGTGKQAELSCGYGCGPAKFRATAALGIYGPPVSLTLQEAEQFVNLYRATHGGVVGYWRQADTVIRALAESRALDWGPLRICEKKIYLPNDAWLHYETLQYDADTREWQVKTRNGWSKLYGGKLVENVIQALARVVMSQAMLRLHAQGFVIVNCTHDEIICLIPAGHDEPNMIQTIIDEMKREPSWLPGIPLDAEGFVSDRYEK
jgi:hypothetical protein